MAVPTKARRVACICSLMTWNTVHIENARAEEPEILTDEIVSRVAPVAHGHFNLQGMFKFDLGIYRSALLEPPRTCLCNAQNLVPE